MKKVLLSLAAVATLAAAAAPAAAQPWQGDHGRYGYGYGGGYAPGRSTTAYVDGLEWKINNAAREGRISWGEARYLRNELRQVQPLAWRVQTGEANGWERARLQRSVDHIEQRVNDEGYGPA